MPDREKVIKEFADYVHYFKPYCIGDIEDHAMLTDALALLKERDPVKPEQSSTSGITWWYICGACKTAIDPGDHYCRYCGRAVKWE